MWFQRNKDPILFAPGPDAVLVDEGEPESAIFRQRKIQQPFVAGEHFEAHLGEHDPIVGNHRRKGDIIDAGGQKFGGLVAFQLEGQDKRIIYESIGKVR